MSLPPGNANAVDISPDGLHVVVSHMEAVADARRTLWTIDVPSGRAQRLTSEGTPEEPVWSSDGGRILYVGPEKNAGLIAALGGPVEGIDVPPRSSPTQWSLAGPVIFMQQNAKTGWDLGAFDVQAAAATPLVSTPALEVSGQLSPDGRWLAYASTEGGRLEVYVQPFPDLKGKWQVSLAGGSQPRWRGDGRELFYISQDRRLMTTTVQPSGDVWKNGPPASLFEVPGPVRTVIFRDYAVAPDGQQFFFNAPIPDPEGALINVILNWPGLLGQR